MGFCLFFSCSCCCVLRDVRVEHAEGVTCSSRWHSARSASLSPMVTLWYPIWWHSQPFFSWYDGGWHWRTHSHLTDTHITVCWSIHRHHHRLCHSLILAGHHTHSYRLLLHAGKHFWVLHIYISHAFHTLRHRYTYFSPHSQFAPFFSETFRP